MADENVAARQLRAFIERAERLNGEKDAVNSDLSELFKEAKGEGYDTKVMKAIISDRAKDPTKKSEFDALYDLYAEALGMLVATRAPAHDEDGVFPETPEPDDQFWQGGEHIHEQQPAPAARDLTVPQALTGQVAPIQTAISDAAFRDPLDWEDEDGAQAVANHTPEMADSGEAVVSTAAAVGASPAIREAEDIGSQPAGGENVAGHPSEDTVEKSDFVDDLTRAGATTSSDVEPVAPSNITQLRAPKPLRPNCLKPTMCGASGPVHCWSCVKALGEHQKAAQ